MNYRLWGLLAATLVLVGTAQASIIFEGRGVNGAVDNTCTASGPSKCAMFYDRQLDITILNNWNIGTGTWYISDTPGAAQYLVNRVGFEATGLHDWFLPSGNGNLAGGSGNQFKSIWDAAGGSLVALQNHFDGVQSGPYWSDTILGLGDRGAWAFKEGVQYGTGQFQYFSVVAVRPGDVAPAAIPVPQTAIPEPQTYSLMLVGLGLITGIARRRNKRK